MEKNDQIFRPPEQDFILQWGNRKRLRCFKVQVEDKMKRTTIRVDRRVIRAEKENPSTQMPDCTQPNRLGSRNSHPAVVKSTAVEGIKVHNNGHFSPDKNDKFPLRGNNGCSSTDDTNKISTDADTMQDNKVSNLGVFVWPKFVVALSSKEKEEDFMAIKGSKLPLRPKKRAKFIQRALHLVSPGAWLCELSQDRYEVREKKSTKKRPRGLKAMGNFETDSD